MELPGDLTFYGVVIHLPGDPATEMPGLPEAFYTWVSKEVVYPEHCDFDRSKVLTCEQILADKIVRLCNENWDRRLGRKAPFFAQLEKGNESVHIHLLLDSEGVNSFVFGRYTNAMKAEIVKTVFRENEPPSDKWFQLHKTGTRGANKLYNEDFIPAYLLKKTQPELQWAWTNIDKYRLATLNLAERARIVEEWEALLSERREQKAESVPKKIGKPAQEYMALVRWLVENGIATERQWMQEDADSYLSYNATGGSRAQIKSSLENAARIMLATKKAADYLVGQSPPTDVTQNRVWRLLTLNGYDPAYAGSILLGWCRSGFGKRNTLWLFGPATTGKTNLAEAISHAVPFFGNVNWTNENFPFNDCVDKMIIWWEEGKMTAKVVESAKAILGGSKVRVDQKCKSSQQIEPTPVIITSNTNMCEVVDGNSTTFEHRQPLEDRMFRFELTVRLQPSFGKITRREIREFFKWAELHEVEVQPDFVVKKDSAQACPGGGVKREAEPLKDAPSPKRVFIPAATSQKEDVREAAPALESDSVNFAERYVSKCVKHLSWSNMRYPCKICEKMNSDVNVCIAHGTRDCIDCFPQPVPVPISDHDYCNVPLSDCDFYVKGGSLDDVNKEQ